ncbi:MAG: antitoxin [Candidatus Kapabacteria bacterium]|nr:antitoxin [Candidatus Kapabacteria bacterium]
MNNIEYIDEEEKEMIESLHELDWQPNPNYDENKKYEQYALNTINHLNKVEINLSYMDRTKIQNKAIEKGIPFQEFISIIVHKYNEGKLNIEL